MGRHVVVVGYGMAGARLTEELRRRDPDAHQLRITVVGAEARPAYNRVLLSTVLAGGLSTEAIDLQPSDWAADHHIDVRLGTRVVAVDRADRRLRVAGPAGTGEIPYDVVVFATGSRPWLPPTTGLTTTTGAPAEGVVAFRTAEDCERIIGVANAGGRVVVLGGGLLGLEAARGLAGRGSSVTVVHPARHLMDRQLDFAAGGVLRRTLSELGVNVRLGVLATRYTEDPAHRGLELDDGSFLPADLVVVAAGVRPEVSVARAAGLAVENGILVDDRLRSVTDPRIRAIGECAEHRGQVHGLVQPAWDQAAVVADLLTGADPDASYRGSRTMTRLKARDIDLAAMGDPGAGDDDGTEVVTIVDATRGRYAKLVLRDDRVAGAILLGSPDAAAQVTQLFDTDAPAPTDRLAMLLGRSASTVVAADSPALMPTRAIVCRCNTVTKGQLTSAWLGGARSVEALATATRATTGCGGCAEAVCGLAEWLAASDPTAGDAVTDEQTPIEEGVA